MTQQAELAYLFRALKAPAAARALPKLAERARAEEWSYERFAEALLQTEVASRDAHGGEARLKQAPLPRPQNAGGVRLQLPTLGAEDTRAPPRPARLPHRQRQRRPLGPARHRQDAPRDRARHPRLPGRPTRRLRDRDRVGRPPRRHTTTRPARRRAAQA